MPNLLKRTISGIIYVGLLVGCLLLGRTTFCILFVVISALLLNEYNNLIEEHKLAQVNKVVSMISGIYLFVAFFLYNSAGAKIIIFAPYIASLLFILISGLYSNHEKPIADWAYTFAGHLFIALPIALMNVLAFNQSIYSYTLPLAIFVFLWLSDSGAYCFGCGLSKYIPYKLFPSISPNKSWIGSIGGGITVLLGATVFYLCDGSASIWFWFGLGLTVCIFGTWGDLVESQFKRQLGIKDSGKLMPGHGGALDRFDSALLAIPAAVVYVMVYAAAF